MKNSKVTREEQSTCMLKGDPTKWDISNVSPTAFSDLALELADRVEVEGATTKWKDTGLVNIGHNMK